MKSLCDVADFDVIYVVRLSPEADLTKDIPKKDSPL